MLGWRFLLAALVGVASIALALGIPTDIIPNPWFVRMTPAGTSNYLFWVASSLFTGVLLATYALPRATRDRIAATTAGSGILGLLAVGCPVCNKLVVALLGVSGAFTYFAPIQPVLGALGVLLAAVALWIRLRGARRACAVPPGVDEPSAI
ncbi:MAG: hypothetical protein JST59_29250 [Actinobacteria bacterium]|nr:hypothetical protein [Actinomycetota bacterium]